jgi:hypothetical protein
MPPHPVLAWPHRRMCRPRCGAVGCNATPGALQRLASARVVRTVAAGAWCPWHVACIGPQAPRQSAFSLSRRRWGNAATAPHVSASSGRWKMLRLVLVSRFRCRRPRFQGCARCRSLRLPGDRAQEPSVAMSSPIFRFADAVDERTSAWVSLITSYALPYPSASPSLIALLASRMLSGRKATAEALAEPTPQPPTGGGNALEGLDALVRRFQQGGQGKTIDFWIVPHRRFRPAADETLR